MSPMHIAVEFGTGQVLWSILWLFLFILFFWLIIMIFTDAEMFNGPRSASPTYGNPPFDGTVGLPDFLPPVDKKGISLVSSGDARLRARSSNNGKPRR